MARAYECSACEHQQIVGVIDNGLSGFADPDARCESCGAVGQFHFGPGVAESMRRQADVMVDAYIGLNPEITGLLSRLSEGGCA